MENLDETIKNEFPIDVFPIEISDYIVKLAKAKKISEGVIASTLLNAAGFVLSDRYQVFVTHNWFERPNLWTAIVLPSGMGKSVITRTIFNKIVERQFLINDEVKKHNALVKECEELIKDFKKEKKLKAGENPIEMLPELRNWLHNHNLNPSIPEYKKPINLFSDDFTFEKFGKMLEDNNGHSFLIRADELAGLFKMFNKYRRGNDEETMLKLWGYDSLRVDRINEESSIFVKNPTIGLFGATQKEMLFDMWNDDRKNNGNIYRFLFCCDNSENTVKNVFDFESDAEFDGDVFDRFINHHLHWFDGEKVINNLTISDDAKNFLREWRDLTKIQYVDSELINFDNYNRIMGKMDSYIIRISIIVNRLKAYYSQSNEDSLVIGADDMIASSKIIDFYVHEIIKILEYTDLSYRKNLKTPSEIEFYENDMPNQAAHFDIVKLMEIKLKYSQVKARNLILNWQEKGLVKRNVKGLIVKTINKKA